MKLDRYMEIIRSKLSEARFIHSVNVSHSARELAKLYGADEEKAAIAGMLHDIMKDTPKEQQLKLLSDFGIILRDVEKVTPSLWHQISGAAYVERVLHIDDPEIISAIRWHTSGKADMTLLDKVIFIADFISADRNYPDVETMRALARESLDKAIVYGLSFTIKEIALRSEPIITDTVSAYNEAILKNTQGKE